MGPQAVKNLSYLLTFIFLAWAQIAIADEFKNVRCNADIPKVTGVPDLVARAKMV